LGAPPTGEKIRAGEMMTREEILTWVKNLAPWFHCIDLGLDLRTKTASVCGEPIDHPHGTWEIIQKCFPDVLSGKSVLDVGCNAGFYAIEVKRRHAARVVGIDAERFHIRQANFVRRVLDLDIEFRRMSVYDLDPRVIGRFDMVLALGLIYHCKHPALALERLARVTNDLLIVETAILPKDMCPSSFVYSMGGLERTLYPFAYVQNPDGSKEAAYNWFLPSVEGLTVMLQNFGFSKVEVVRSEGERAVLVGYKERTNGDRFVMASLAARLAFQGGPNICRPGAELIFEVEAENIGFNRWSARREASSKGVVALGAHLLRETDEEVKWDYARMAMKKDIEPGEAARFRLPVTAPVEPGGYILEFDMVFEPYSWFEDLGSVTLRHELRVDDSDKVRS
jgi:tRNA (mo5U34)-methyltransferase